MFSPVYIDSCRYRELSAKGERYLLMRGCGAGNVLPMMPGCLMLLLASERYLKDTCNE
jgi:hypothetical protein